MKKDGFLTRALSPLRQTPPAKEPRPVEHVDFSDAFKEFGQTGESLEERIALLRYRFSDLQTLRDDYIALSKPMVEFLGLHAASKARLAEVEALLGHTSKEGEALRSELSSYRRLTENLKLEAAQLKEAVLGKDDLLRGQEEQIRGSLAAADEARSKLDWQDRQLHAESERARGLTQLNRKITAELNELEGRFAAEQARAGELRDAASLEAVEMTRLRQALDGLKPAHIAAKRRVTELEADLLGIRQALASAELKFNSERDARLASEQMREQDKISTESELAFLTAQYDALSGRFAATEKLLEQARGLAAERGEEARSADRNLKDVTAQLAAVERRATLAQEEARRLAAQHEAADAAAREAGDRSTMLTKALAAKDAQVVQTLSKAEALAEQLEAAQARHEQTLNERDAAYRKLLEEHEREKAERALAQGALTIARASRESLMGHLEALKKRKGAVSEPPPPPEPPPSNVHALRTPPPDSPRD